jgi:hypothetical protein
MVIGSFDRIGCRADYHTGDNMIHLGGSRAPYLLLPLIPAAK